MIEQIRGFIRNDVLKIVSGSPDFGQIGNGAWEDIMHHTFRCTNCGQAFSLSVDTYHGNGGVWEPLDQ